MNWSLGLESLSRVFELEWNHGGKLEWKRKLITFVLARTAAIAKRVTNV